MIILIFAVFGLLFGLFRARRHGGTRLDMVQYAASYTIAMTLLGLFFTIFVLRLVA